MFFSSCLLIDIAGSYPGLAVVLEEWGLETGRMGSQTLQAACVALGLDLQAVNRALERAKDACPAGFAGMSRVELVTHVRLVHHDYLRRILPELQDLAHDALRLYGSQLQHLRHVNQIVRVLTEELYQHIAREEQFAFPWVGSQELSPLDRWMMDCLSEERRRSSFRIDCLRFLTNHYTWPESAGESLRRLYLGLRELDRDFQRYVYVEERFLFPRQLAA